MGVKCKLIQRAAITLKKFWGVAHARGTICTFNHLSQSSNMHACQLWTPCVGTCNSELIFPHFKTERLTLTTPVWKLEQ